jgi:pilus assembly protein CpaF
MPPALPLPTPSASAPPTPAVVPTPPGNAGRRPLPTDAALRAKEVAQTATHRAALATLVARAADAVDEGALRSGAPLDESAVQRAERIIAERFAAMTSGGEVPPDVDADVLVAEAGRELCALGPLGPLLADEDVSEIQVIRHDFVVAMRARRQVVGEVAFTSEAALVRALRRLCVASGRPLTDGERYVERRMPNGGRLFAVMPSGPDQGHALVIRKPQRADLTLEDLVRSGTISRAMAGLLSQCVAARANILVTGSIGAGTTSLLGAFAGAGGTDDRVIVLQEADEIVFSQPHTISLLLGDTPEEDALAVRAATRVHPDRLVIGAFAGHVAAEVVDAIGDGVDGVLAAARAPNLRQAVARLPADLAATRPGITPEAAREWLASAFDLALEIARLRDGRHRVLRVAELATEGGGIALRDVFTFVVERTAAGGALEGTFHPTGHVPRIVEDLASRGLSVDSAIFKRHAPR